MKDIRVIVAFGLYAAVGLVLGVIFEGACIGFANGDLTFAQIAEDDQPYKKVLDTISAAAKDVRFWILPALIAVGLGAFWAHAERSDGTAFDFENESKPWWETYGD
jgi:hypothetical protein